MIDKLAIGESSLDAFQKTIAACVAQCDPRDYDALGAGMLMAVSSFYAAYLGMDNGARAFYTVADKLAVESFKKC